MDSSRVCYVNINIIILTFMMSDSDSEVEVEVALRCLVWGRSALFQVTVPVDDIIYNLKKLVYEHGRYDLFCYLTPRDLVLWKVRRRTSHPCYMSSPTPLLKAQPSDGHRTLPQSFEARQVARR